MLQLTFCQQNTDFIVVLNQTLQVILDCIGFSTLALLKGFSVSNFFLWKLVIIVKTVTDSGLLISFTTYKLYA